MHAIDAPADVSARDTLVERMVGAVISSLDLFSVYLGDRLGYYQALADGQPTTSGELAERTGTAERYAREWLEQQAITGILPEQVTDLIRNGGSWPGTFTLVTP
jgi:hypothetical protein